MKKTLALLGVVLAATTALTGCASGKSERGRADAPVGTEVNSDPASIVEMPDNFANVAYKCVGPDMVYVTSRASTSAGHGLVVIASHPDCAA